MPAYEDKNMLWEDIPIDVSQDANFIWSIANKLRGVYMPDKHSHASNPLVALSGVEIKLTVPEEKKLSLIIKEVNARAGKSLDNDVITKAVLQIKDLLLKSEKLRTSARNNTEKDFEFNYYDDMDDALVEGLSQNQDFFTFLLDNADVKKEVLEIFLHDVYSKLRNSEKEVG